MIYDWFGSRPGRSCLVLDEIGEGPELLAECGVAGQLSRAFQLDGLVVIAVEGHSGWPGWSVLLPFAVGGSVVHPQIGILAIVAYTDKGNT